MVCKFGYSLATSFDDVYLTDSAHFWRILLYCTFITFLSVMSLIVYYTLAILWNIRAKTKAKQLKLLGQEVQIKDAGQHE